MNPRECLILNNHTLVHSVLSRHFPTRKFDEDAIEVGMVGLVTAANTFDPSRNVAFSTFAYRVIYNEISSYLQNESKHATLVSLDTPISEDEYETISLKDTIADVDFRPEMDLKLTIDKLLPKLTETHAALLMGLVEGKSVDDLAEELGMHPNSIRRSLRKLREKIKRTITV